MIDPYVPLEKHSVQDLVAEIHRLNRLCQQHEVRAEELQQQIVPEDEIQSRVISARYLGGVIPGLALGLSIGLCIGR